MLDTDIVQMKHKHWYHTGSNLISCSKVLQAMYKHPQALANTRQQLNQLF